MRAMWSGGISFGLIYIPVNLYSATQAVQIDLDMLSKKDLSPIRYAKINKETGKEVAWKDVVKGYEYQKGDYVVLTDEDFDSVDIHRSNSIEITSFVNTDEIDPIYFEKPYYLEPAKGAEKTYLLLIHALKKTKKVGVAEFVFKNREHLCIIKPEGNMLLLNQLRYESEIKSSSELNLPKNVTLSEKEVKMAEQLIDGLTEEFNASDYKDDYVNALKKVINAKVNKKPIKTSKETPKPTDINKVMEQLEASLKEIKESRKNK
jgi:DNA end-binding protein Ku